MKQEKTVKKLNIIDILVIILVVVVAAGIAFRFVSGKMSSMKDTVTVEYVVKVQGVRQYTADVLKAGDIVTDVKGETEKGVIKNVEVTETYDTRETADGKMSVMQLPKKYTCYVTIETQAKEDSNAYILADTTEPAVGRMTDLITKYCHTSGEIIEVRKISE